MTKKISTSSRSLFRDPSGQADMFEKSYEEELEAKNQAPVTCLGLTFENDKARRDHFLELLRDGIEELEEKFGGVSLKSVQNTVKLMRSIDRWPMGDDRGMRDIADRIHNSAGSKDLLQLWKDDVGFPHGEIEDILAISNPPFFTACPNPFIRQFAEHYGKPYDHQNDNFHREPLAADVSQGKNHPIYRAHSYHTKVPHRAVMRYILNYTEPGDLVFDGFCGTGMTGVAAKRCGDRVEVESLGYHIDDKGNIYEGTTNETEVSDTSPFSRLGPRLTVLDDLSPVAAFVSHVYNSPLDRREFQEEANRIISDIEQEFGWMYETIHSDGNTEGQILYTVWSDIFVCPQCAHEVVFWDVALDHEEGAVRDQFQCPSCNVRLSKRNMKRAWSTEFDKALGQTVDKAKQVPVLINYRVGKSRFRKEPDHLDLALIDEISRREIPTWYPMDRLPPGHNTQQPITSHGLTHTHHFYTRRNLIVLSAINAAIRGSDLRSPLTFQFNSLAIRQSKLTRLIVSYFFRGGGGWVGTPLTGTLYVPSLNIEVQPFETWKNRIPKTLALESSLRQRLSASSTGNAARSGLASECVDYIFIDPPFGGNLMYSELNFLWEAWLKVFTNNVPEAITNKVQGKALLEYQRLMTECFQEYYRVLKPGRWMTVEFHNSKNRVWNVIQEALQTVGFVIADVRTLDKMQGSFKQVTSASAVKQDLVISCYRPNGGLEKRFKLNAGSEQGAWDFIRAHVNQLPVFVSKDGIAEVIAERQSFLLFDRMVAFHVQRGVSVPLSAAEFYAGLAQRFPERDGMYFLPEQAAEYDKKRLTVKEIQQLQLFVTDEESSILWLKQQLSKKPQTFQELHPQFLKEIGGWQKHEKPLELSELLEQNYLRYDGKGKVPSQIHGYLSSNYKDLRKLPKDDEALRSKGKDRWYVPDPNKQVDLEKLRERTLLREFEEYRDSKQKRLKIFRLEAVRAGFKKAWQERDYETIIAVAEKIPEKVLQEDPKLLMWYDQAITRNADA